MAKPNMKRIHKVILRRIIDESIIKTGESQPGHYVGIRADAEILIPISEMHTRKCQQLNDKRAQYACECKSGDSLIQHITSGGLWGVEWDTDSKYIAEIQREELDSLSTQLHALGFSKRAIASAFKNVTEVSE